MTTKTRPSRVRTRQLQRPQTPNDKRLRFTQREVQRVIKAARAMGLPIGKIEVDPGTGVITVVPGTTDTADNNEWDDTDGKAPTQVR
jgi:hypothetical protein